MGSSRCQFIVTCSCKDHDLLYGRPAGARELATNHNNQILIVDMPTWELIIVATHAVSATGLGDGILVAQANCQVSHIYQSNLISWRICTGAVPYVFEILCGLVPVSNGKWLVENLSYVGMVQL